jgi:hypothetical protein
VRVLCDTDDKMVYEPDDSTLYLLLQRPMNITNTPPELLQFEPCSTVVYGTDEWNAMGCDKTETLLGSSSSMTVTDSEAEDADADDDDYDADDDAFSNSSSRNVNDDIMYSQYKFFEHGDPDWKHNHKNIQTNPMEEDGD